MNSGLAYRAGVAFAFPTSMRALCLYCENKMRKEMHGFIDELEDADLRFFANPALFLGDVQYFKEQMHAAADDISLHAEMQYLMHGGIAIDFLAHQSKQSREMIVEVKKTSLSKRNEETHEHFINQECGIWDFYSRLITSNPFYTREGPTREGELTSTLDEMYTQLLCRLIDTMKYFFLIDHREKFKDVCENAHVFQNRFKVMDLNRSSNWKAELACSRDEFLRRAKLEPPELLRVIDIEATCKPGLEHVVLIDYSVDCVQQVGYTAISHTYGMDVYDVFNCPCASECSSARPRCWAKPCAHATEHQDSEKHKRVVDDILKMCHILRKAGVSYAWHDGVCIAQHDMDEVNKTIMHMGWIYSEAKETVIFLHYVGDPMAPIRNSNDTDKLCCRWHTRVWTLQEGALSKCRRYCVRVGTSPLGDCKSLEEFEQKIDLWYGHNSSTIQILEEESFFELVKDIYIVLTSLLVKQYYSLTPADAVADDDVKVQTNWMLYVANKWYRCTKDLLHTLLWLCFKFPTLEAALVLCSGRESKHKGDRINSILSLAEVKGFVAHKDEKLEASTIEFFKKQGQLGLGRAVFSSYAYIDMDKQYINMKEQKHTWPPVLWIGGLVCAVVVGDPYSGNWEEIEFEVLEDGRMELRSRDFYWMIWVPVRFTYNNVTNADMEVDSMMNDGLVWDMKLVDFNRTGAFKAKLFGASVGDVNISAIKRSNSEKHVFAEEIINGSCCSFDAHLVIIFDEIKSPVLIVQGSLLDAHVSKVGVFLPTNDEEQSPHSSFWKLLEDNLPPASAFIKKLIII